MIEVVACRCDQCHALRGYLIRWPTPLHVARVDENAKINVKARQRYLFRVLDAGRAFEVAMVRDMKITSFSSEERSPA